MKRYQLLKIILLSVFSVLLTGVYISCLLKSWQLIAMMVLSLSGLTIKKTVDLLPVD